MPDPSGVPRRGPKVPEGTGFLASPEPVSAAERPQPGHGPHCTPNPDYDNERCVEHGNLVVPSPAAAIPMTPIDERGACTDPLTIAIAHAFEVYDLDDIEAQDGDMLRGLARLAGATIHENYPHCTEGMDEDGCP